MFTATFPKTLAGTAGDFDLAGVLAGTVFVADDADDFLGEADLLPAFGA